GLAGGLAEVSPNSQQRRPWDLGAASSGGCTVALVLPETVNSDLEGEIDVRPGCPIHVARLPTQENLARGVMTTRPAHFLARRDILQPGALGVCGLTLPTLLERQALAGRAATVSGRAKSCILIFHFGGPPQQDTFDLKPGAPAEVRGEFRPIPTTVPG